MAWMKGHAQSRAARIQETVMAEKDAPKEAPKHPLANVQMSNETVALLSALVEQLIARQPSDPNNMGLPEEKRRELTAMPGPGKYKRVPLKSEDTDATFDAIVVESAKHPNGRIVRIENYRHPEDGMTTHVSAGGRVPDGMQITSKEGTDANSNSNLTVEFKRWRMEYFLQRDFRFYIGRGLQDGYCAPGSAGVKTPWASAPFFGSVDAEQAAV
jgi:hypothetical protein